MATIPAYLNSSIDDAAAAEIATVSADGRTVIYTDSPGERLGFLDVTDPAAPRPAGVLELPGEPTSVAVLGRCAVAAVNTSTSTRWTPPRPAAGSAFPSWWPWTPTPSPWWNGTTSAVPPPRSSGCTRSTYLPASAPRRVAGRDQRLVADLLPALSADHGWVQDEVEGLAIGGDGETYAVTDNDALDDATGDRLPAAGADRPPGGQPWRPAAVSVHGYSPALMTMTRYQFGPTELAASALGRAGVHW